MCDDWMTAVEAAMLGGMVAMRIDELNDDDSSRGFKGASLSDGDSSCLKHTNKHKKSMHACITETDCLGWSRTKDNLVDKVLGGKMISDSAWKDEQGNTGVTDGFKSSILEFKKNGNFQQ